MDLTRARGYPRPSGGRAGADFVARMRARHEEIEQETLARVHSITDPIEIAYPEYDEGLKLAVSTAVEYGLMALERNNSSTPPPPVLLAQARLAARSGVRLDTVLRRYFAGYTLFGDFLVQEVGKEGEIGRDALTGLLRREAMLFDQLIAAITEEYRLEQARVDRSTDQERTRLVQSLLDGELIDPSVLAYDLDGWHLGVVAAGLGAAEALRNVSRALDRSLLLVHPRHGITWAWLGGRRRIAAGEVIRSGSTDWPDGLVAAVGEPARGVAGWRSTYRQARDALRVATYDSVPIVSYAEVGLLACVLGDETLVSALRELYLEPLAGTRDGGEALRATLRAYFGAGGHVSSTAAALGVTRRTVNNRLRTIEEKLGGSIDSHSVDLQIALRLAALEERPGTS